MHHSRDVKSMGSESIGPFVPSSRRTVMRYFLFAFFSSLLVGCETESESSILQSFVDRMKDDNDIHRSEVAGLIHVAALRAPDEHGYQEGKSEYFLSLQLSGGGCIMVVDDGAVP